MEILNEFIANSQIPIFSAWLLGLLTAISPCPLATNITAIGFISKDLHDKRRIFLNGLFYTLGRAVSYSALGVLMIVLLRQGGSVFKIQQSLSSYGGYFLGPILVLIGVFMFDFVKVNFVLLGNTTSKMERKAQSGNIWSSFLLGVLFALAFCPYSGILFFGGLIPLSVASAEGYVLPLIFAIATGLPVVMFAWILAYSLSGLSSIYNKIKSFEFWFRRVVAIVFIAVGFYYISVFYF